MSIELKYKHLEEAYPELLQGIGVLIQKIKISNRFRTIVCTKEEYAELEKAKELCELRIIEQWEDKTQEPFKALCSTYFDISSQIPIESDNEYIVYEYIKLISCAYLGENWHMARQYLRNHKNKIFDLNVTEKWNSRLLLSSFKALTGLIIRSNWKDIESAVTMISQLRVEQKKFESDFLSRVADEIKGYEAAELVSMYHFARTVEILGEYLLNGRPPKAEEQITYHLGYAYEYSRKAGNITLELLFQFYEALAHKLIKNTIWYNTQGINNWVTEFNKFISHREDHGVFELLYPQRASIIEGELLNPAHRAIVVNLPTSSGKTMIAQYRILMALNTFKQSGGWVAYVVPTRALVNQIYIQFKRELGKIGVKVEKVSGAIELDGFEEALLEKDKNNTQFDVLVTTYEKLNLLIRQGYGTQSTRPLVLAVIDEAHNIEEETRGINLELLLSTIKNDCEEANFLLMTPDIHNSKEIASWLAGDRGKDIHLNLHWWQPNERVIGALKVDGRGRNYDINLHTLLTNKGTYSIGNDIQLASFENAEKRKSDFYGANGSKVQLSSILASRLLNPDNPIIVLARNPAETFKVAEILTGSVNRNFPEDDEIELISRYIDTEMGADFPLSKYLAKRIGIHSAALPEEIRWLMEDLMAREKLQALVATTTIAQGINFPVSGVVAGSLNYFSSGSSCKMPVRDFWNLAGRVGRAGQQEMGWVGIALKNDDELPDVVQYVKNAADELRSQLVNIIKNAIEHSNSDIENWLFFDPRWSAILQYISHLYNQSREMESFLSQLEQKLQSTLGYSQLDPQQKEFFRNRIRKYTETLTAKESEWADSTGFSTISVKKMIGKLSSSGLNPKDWNKDQLFSEQNQNLSKLVGIMLDTPEIRKSMSELSHGEALNSSSIARLITDWVNGKNIAAIAERFYQEEDISRSIEKTTKALYKVIANAATWGLAALQKMPTSGIDWESLNEAEKRQMANLPSYLYYGVNTDEGVLMRKNNVPRSIANRLGELYNESVGGDIFGQSTDQINNWIKNQNVDIWESIKPGFSKMSGSDYKSIWEKLSGNALE